ncbi:MAG: GNAT family N-acetyltransferase [Acidobacteriota bacterium]
MEIREARAEDLLRLVEMLADDPLGRERERFESPLPDGYHRAFESIDSDPNHVLLVAETEGEVIGQLQLSFLPNLTYQGSWRAQVEGVRVASSQRGAGIGRQLVEAAIERARERGCHLVQLTTDKQRPEALAFYESLGFVASHEGMKLKLESGG